MTDRRNNVTATPASRRKAKPGPAPFQPSSDDRLSVELGIAGGSSAAALARVFDVSRRTFNRAFANEIETGRTRMMVAMSRVLYEAATKDRNVAAAKALLGFFERAGKPEVAAQEDDRWAHLLNPVQDGSPILPDSEILPN